MSRGKAVGEWSGCDYVIQLCYSYQVPSERLTVADGQVERSASIFIESTHLKMVVPK